MPLSTVAQGHINQASRKSVENEFAKLNHNWNISRWLKTNNRYADNSVSRITRDLKDGNRPHVSHLREYIVASSVLHCMDGWSYLGRSLISFLSGDIDVSRHLAYYAELRAVMSILASEGIGVFEGKHAYISNKGNCYKIGGYNRTHTFAWEAFDYWGQLSRSSDLLLSGIFGEGYSASEWLNYFTSASGSIALIGQNWFSRWGLDLKRLSSDREARNLVSYRPTSLSSSSPPSPEKALEFVSHIWEMCEPKASERFYKLDQFLLRQSIEFVFKLANAGDRSRKQASKLYARQVDSMLHQLNPNNDQKWSDFLKFNTEPDLPQIIIQASGKLKPHNPGHERQVLSRATILLKTATNSCDLLFKEISLFNSNQLRFWWEQLGESRPLWKNGNDPSHMTDLWNDVETAISDIENWINKNTHNNISYEEMWKELASSAAVLSTCERIGLWGFGL